MGLQSYIKDMLKEGRRFFTIQDVIKQLHISYNHAKVAVHRLMKTGDLLSPARGFYVVIPLEHQPCGPIPAEELVPLIMRHLGINYYVALLAE